MEKKITLFWFNTPATNRPNFASLTIAFLAQILQKHNIDVTSIDGNQLFSEEGIIESPEDCFKKLIWVTEKTNPDVLAMGSWSVNFPFVLEFAKEFKKRNPNVIILLGGYNPTLMPKFILENYPFIDILIQGEGAYTLLDLMQKLNKGLYWGSIEGIAYRKDGQVRVTKPRKPINDLDKLPFLDFSSFKFLRLKSAFLVYGARGCLSNCSYCSLKTMRYKFRKNSSSYILKQIKILADKFPLECISFIENDFFSDKKRFFRIIDGIVKEKLDIFLRFTVRLDSFNKEIISKISNSKVKIDFIFAGLESINPSSLKFFNKTNNPIDYLNKVSKNIKNLSQTNIRCQFSTIIGAPHETRKDIMDLTNFICSLNKIPNFNAYSGLIVPYGGSTIWQKYRNSEIEIFKIKNKRFRRSNAGFFSKKYEDILEFVPTAYTIKNKTMKPEIYEKFVGQMLDKIKDFGWLKE